MRVISSDDWAAVKGPLELNDHESEMTPVNMTVCFPIFIFSYTTAEMEWKEHLN